MKSFGLGLKGLGGRLSREQQLGVIMVHLLKHPQASLTMVPKSLVSNPPETVLEFALAAMLAQRRQGRRRGGHSLPFGESVELSPPVAKLLLQFHSKQLDAQLLGRCLDRWEGNFPSHVEVDLNDLAACEKVFSRLDSSNLNLYPQAAGICLRLLGNSRALDLLCQIPHLPDEPVWQAFLARTSDLKWDRVSFSDSLLARIVNREFSLGNFRYIADLFRNQSTEQQQQVILQACGDAYATHPTFIGRQFLSKRGGVSMMEEADLTEQASFKLFRDSHVFSPTTPMWEKRRAVLNLAFESFENELEVLHEIQQLTKYIDVVDLSEMELGFALKHLYLQPQASEQVRLEIESLIRNRECGGSPATYTFFLHDEEEQQIEVKRWNAFHSFRSLASENAMPLLTLGKCCNVWRKLEASGYVLHASEERLLYDLFRHASHSNDDASTMEDWILHATHSRNNTIALAGYFAKNDLEPLPKQRSRWDFFKRLFKTPMLKETPSSWQYVKRYVSRFPGEVDLAVMDLLCVGLKLRSDSEVDLQQWFVQDGLYQKLYGALLRKELGNKQLTNVEGMIDLSGGLFGRAVDERDAVEAEYNWDTGLISQVPIQPRTDQVLLDILVQIFKPWLGVPPVAAAANSGNKPKFQHRIQQDLAQIVDFKLRESAVVSLGEASLLCHLAAIATLQDKLLPPPNSPQSKQSFNDMKSKSPLQLWKNERVAQLPVVLAAHRCEESERNRLASLQLCGQLNLLAPLLPAKSTYHLQRAMLYSLHPSHSKTNSRCFAQMFAMQTSKPSFGLVDFKFVLKTVEFIAVSQECKSVAMGLVYLGNIFAPGMKKNPNEMVLEPLFDRCIDTLLKKMIEDFPKFRQDDPEFLPCVFLSFELMSKILEFSADNLPGYQYKVFSQKQLVHFCLRQFLTPHHDFPGEVLRQVFLLLQNLFAFEKRIATEICSSREFDFVIETLNWALSSPQVRQSESLALAVMNAYFALIHANPDAYLDLVGKQAVEALEANVKRIEMHSFEFHSRAFNTTFDEFSTLDIYLVAEEFRDFLTKLAKREQ